MTLATIAQEDNLPVPISEDTTEARLRRRGDLVISQAKALSIEDADTCELAAEQRNEIRTAIKEAEEFFRPICEATHAAHKAATSRREQVVGAWKSALAILSDKIGGYHLRAEQERQRAIRNAEQKSLEAALQEQEERAAELAAAGAEEEVALEMARPVLVAPVEILEAPRSEHVTFRDDWVVEVIDAAAVPREFCIPDEAAIHAYVRATKGARAVPGVRITAKKITVTKRGR